MGVAELTGCALEQGKAIVRAIEALETVESTEPIERVQAWFLLQTYRRWLRAIVEAAPARLAEEILSASQRAGSDRPGL